MDAVRLRAEDATAELLSAADLESLGATRRDVAALVESGELTRVRRNAYTGRRCDRAEDRYRLEVLAALAAAPGTVLTGPAALALLDLPPLRGPSTIHVATSRRGGRGARSRLSPVAPNPAAGPPRTLPAAASGPVPAMTAPAAAAILDTARLFSLPVAVAAADAALRRGLTRADELAVALEGLGAAKGVARARTCVEIVDGRSESPGESWSAVVLHEHRLPPPDRQVELSDSRGPVGRVDFWWAHAGVAGEFDGRVKYGRTNPSGRAPEDVLWDEKRREDRLRALGARVVRWTTADLHRPADMIMRLRHALA